MPTPESTADSRPAPDWSAIRAAPPRRAWPESGAADALPDVETRRLEQGAYSSTVTRTTKWGAGRLRHSPADRARRGRRQADPHRRTRASKRPPGRSTVLACVKEFRVVGLRQPVQAGRRDQQIDAVSGRRPSTNSSARHTSKATATASPPHALTSASRSWTDQHRHHARCRCGTEVDEPTREVADTAPDIERHRHHRRRASAETSARRRRRDGARCARRSDRRPRQPTAHRSGGLTRPGASSWAATPVVAPRRR